MQISNRRDPLAKEEREQLLKLVNGNRFNGYLFVGAGLAIAVFLWFFIDVSPNMKPLKLLPGGAAIAGAVWYTRRLNAAYSDALSNGATVVTSAPIDSKNYGEQSGHTIQIVGTRFYVPRRVWSDLSRGDIIDARCIPGARILLELKKEGRILYRISPGDPANRLIKRK